MMQALPGSTDATAFSAVAPVIGDPVKTWPASCLAPGAGFKSQALKWAEVLVSGRAAVSGQERASAFFRTTSAQGSQVGNFKRCNAGAVSVRFDFGTTRALQGAPVLTGQNFSKASHVRPGEGNAFFAETPLLGVRNACPGDDGAAKRPHGQDSSDTPCGSKFLRPQSALASWLSPDLNAYNLSHGWN